MHEGKQPDWWAEALQHLDTLDAGALHASDQGAEGAHAQQQRLGSLAALLLKQASAGTPNLQRWVGAEGVKAGVDSGCGAVK